MKEKWYVDTCQTLNIGLNYGFDANLYMMWISCIQKPCTLIFYHQFSFYQSFRLEQDCIYFARSDFITWSERFEKLNEMNIQVLIYLMATTENIIANGYFLSVTDIMYLKCFGCVHYFA